MSATPHNFCLTPHIAKRDNSPLLLAGVPERPKGSDCKSDGTAFVGSNPTPCTMRRGIIKIVVLAELTKGNFKFGHLTFPFVEVLTGDFGGCRRV